MSYPYNILILLYYLNLDIEFLISGYSFNSKSSWLFYVNVDYIVTFHINCIIMSDFLLYSLDKLFKDIAIIIKLSYLIDSAD